MGGLASKKKKGGGDGGEETERRVQANQRAFNDTFQYAGNHIKTSKYNLITFFPKNLFEQFQRLANFYFLILMILQLIPYITSLTPLTTILPLIAVLFLTAVKDGIDDYIVLAQCGQSSLDPQTTAVPLLIVLTISAVKDLVDDAFIPEISSMEPYTTVLPLFLVLCMTALKDAYDDYFIPAISSMSVYTTILPLFFVLGMTALKDAFDDYQRHRSDNQVNNRKSLIVRDGKIVEEKWQNVKVGDVIKMENDNFVAADLLLLSTSEPHGLCYIETAELDGETNLKARQCLTETAELGETMDAISGFDGLLTCEAPNNRLNSFEGKLGWGGEDLPVDNDKILLRGCVLRNTKWCFGLVVFAGRDTKLMMNCGKTKFKRTSLDRFLNVLIIGIVIFLLSMCLICTILCGIWEHTTGQHFQAFLPWDGIVPQDKGKGPAITFIAFLVFFSYAILLNTVVPISLYVSVEIIRFCHSWWINWDKEMYDPISDSPARARTTTLNEELGQIQYIFSDKTGTLTQNIMTFNKASIGGKLYGDVLDMHGNVIEVSENTKRVDFSSNQWADPKFNWYDPKLLEDTRRAEAMVALFWRLLALCHTVMPEEKEGGVLNYQAQSPDEEALTMAARNFGFVFRSRTPKSITIEVAGVEERYDLICILDFNNVRKRMSVLVRDAAGKLLLLCKGADTMVLERVKASPLKDLTQAHLDKFAGEGLRTLVCAYKEISEEFFASWSVRQREAALSLDDRQARQDAVYEEIETDMTLIGATAIEDKLQDGVPRTIANLAAANIKIWVLTGDKQETAINIGYSCHLLTEDMIDVFTVDAHEQEEVEHQLSSIKREMDGLSRRGERNNGVAPDPSSNDEMAPNGNVILSSNQHAGSSGNICDAAAEAKAGEGYALVINGHSLTHALEPSLEQLFLEIGCGCKAVICCRVTPLQKAMVVDLVKRNKKAVTLSIGDGANDVSMIKTAHIGVGISGQEGMQAVLASDYSIAQFRFLERLLLVHGRWSYFRMSKFLKYFFYKNFAFTLAHFWYAFFCGYSAQTVYDPAFIACYNLFFTSMPVLALGIFDQDVNERYSLSYPKLYIPGQYNLYFNMRIFVYSVLHGVLSSLVLFFIPYGALHDNIASNGLDIGDYDTLSFTVFSALVVVVTAQIALDTSYWTVFNHVVIWGSLAVFYFFAIMLYEAIPFTLIHVGSFGVAFRAMGTAQYWFCILLTTVLLLLPVVAVRFFWFDTHPTLSDRLRVRQNLRRLQKGVSELPLRPFSRSSARRRRGSVRSGYAFAHQQGFGELITKGLVWRAFGSAAGMTSRDSPKKLSPIREDVPRSGATSPAGEPSTSVLHSPRHPSATPNVEEVL